MWKHLLAGLLLSAVLAMGVNTAYASEDAAEKDTETEGNPFDEIQKGRFTFAKELFLYQMFSGSREDEHKEPESGGEENNGNTPGDAGVKVSGTDESTVEKKADSSKTMYVNTPGHENLRIRSSGSMEAEEIGIVPYGSSLTVHMDGSDKKWARITYNGTEGYCYFKFLSDSQPAEQPVSKQETETAGESYIVYGTEDFPTAEETTESAGNTGEENNSEAEIRTENNGGIVSLGTFRITFYCSCPKCCGRWSGGATSSGRCPEAGRTIAVDPSVIPLGSNVIINGHTYVAEDTGVSGNCIDVFMDSHQAALDRGVEYVEVYQKV